MLLDLIDVNFLVNTDKFLAHILSLYHKKGNPINGLPFFSNSKIICELNERLSLIVVLNCEAVDTSHWIKTSVQA